MSSSIQGTIASTGVGSGLDIQSLVSKLVAAEGQAKQKTLTDRQSTVQTQISAFGSFKSAATALQAAVAALKDPKSFQTRGASIGDSDVATVSTDQTAAPGTYNIEVQQLATGSKLVSGPQASASTVLGTGTLTLSAGSNSISVTIDSSNNTLSGIRDAINQASGSSGISAALVTATDGVRLVLTSSTTGAANDLRVTQSGGDGGLAPLVYDPANNQTTLTRLQAAQDSKIKVDGFAHTSPSNSVSDAISGVTINLKATSATGVTTPVTVSVNANAIQTFVQSFVTGYNAAIAGLRQLNAYDQNSKQGGALLGDATLNGFLSSTRSIVGGRLLGTAGSAIGSLAQVGITSNLDGTLNFDAAKFGTAFQSDPNGVANLFSGKNGIASSLDTMLTSYTQPGGLLDSRTTGLQATLKDLGNQQTQLQTYLDSYQSRLLAQFNAMDTMVAQLKQTGDSLTSQLNSIDYNYFGSKR